MNPTGVNQRDLNDDMGARQTLMHQALEDVVDELGQFDQTIGDDGAHYMGPDKNVFAAQGMQCSNCVFFEGGRACELVQGDIDPAGLCKLWIIPETLLPADMTEPAGELPERAAKAKTLRRNEAVLFERAADGEDNLTYTFPFSSEYPVQRYFGNEVLSHDLGAADLSRMNDAAPLLWNHDTNKVIGVVERAWIDEQQKRGYTTVRFSRNAFAQEILADVRDGVLRNVSFAYSVDNMEERSGNFVVTKWTPYEASIVSVPADNSVGIGRSLDAEPAATAATQPQPEPEVHMESTPDLSVVRAEAAEAERSRISGITALCSKHGMSDLAGELVRGGKDIDAARAAVLERIGSKQQPVREVSDLGMNEKEVRDFSFVRAINALANPTDRAAQRAAAFEFEVSEAAAAHYGKDNRGITVPMDVLKRDLTVGTATAGGNTVATDLLAGDFITLLRNRAVIMGLGTRVMTGLQGNVAIPRATAAATAYWVAESGAPTESQQAFDQVTLSPKTVGAYTDISRKLLLQSSLDVESFVRDDLATVLGLEIDRAAINGSGSSNQPTGILQTSGIGSVAGGTNGAAPSYANIIDLESQVAVANADMGSLSYLTNPKVRGKLKGTFTNSTYGEIPIYGADNTLNGYGVAVTNQVPYNLTKGSASGVCSAIIFGNFADLMIGMWGSISLMVDPYTSSTSGTVRVVALQDIDIAVRNAVSFAAMKDALTT